MKYFKSFILTLFALSVAINVAPSVSQAISNETLESIVKIYTVDSEGNAYSGTGFFISSDGVILTNRHVILDETTNAPAKHIYVCVIESSSSVPACYFSADVLTYGTDVDLALLMPAYSIDENWNEIGDPLIENTDFVYPYLDFADEMPELGDNISILGFPAASLSSAITLTKGSVSSLIEYSYQDINFPSYIVSDATANPGNSGGPVLNEDEKVVGVLESITTDGLGGNYSYTISLYFVAIWFYQVADAGYIQEEFVNEIFSNDSQVSEVAETSVSTKVFTDVDLSTKNGIAIASLKDRGILQGYSDGSFKPFNRLNRAELLKILVAGKGYNPDSSYSNCFPDVKDEWFAPYVCFAKSKNWIAGYPDGTFKASSYVNKAEAIKMLLEVFEVNLTGSAGSPYEDVSSDQWFSRYITIAKNLGILEEEGSMYYPANDITRGMVSENIYRLLLTESIR